MCLEKVNCVELFLDGNKITSLSGVERFFKRNSNFRISVGQNNIQDFSPLIKILKDRCIAGNQETVYGDERDRVFSYDVFSDLDYYEFDLKDAFPVHAAVFFNYPDILLSLIENKADINKKYFTFSSITTSLELYDLNERDFRFFNTSALEIVLELERLDCLHVLLFSNIDLSIIKKVVKRPYKNPNIRLLLENAITERNIFSLKFKAIQTIREKNVDIPANYPPLLLKYNHPKYNLNKRKTYH